MKKHLLPIVLFCCAQSALAQYGNQFQYNAFFKTSGAFDYPSELGTDIRTLSVNLTGLNYYIGNSIADVNWFYQVATNVTTGKIDDDEVPVLRNADGTAYLLPHVILDQIVNNTPATNFFVTGITAYPPLAIAVKFKAGDDKKEIVTMGFNHRVKTGFSYYFGKDVFTMLYNGNASFGDEPIDLLDLNVSFNAYSEWCLSTAFPLLSLSNGMKIRTGINLKYLVGYAALQTGKANLSLNSADPAVWDFNLDYLFDVALPLTGEDDKINANYVRTGLGHGLGFDIGTSIQLVKHIKAFGAVNDIGNIHYGGGNVRNYSGTGQVSFDGVRMGFKDLDTKPDFNADSLLAKYMPTETQRDFFMQLPTRITLGGSYGISEKETRKGESYYRHTVHLTYIQGLNKAPGNSTRPFVNVAYALRMGNLLSAGLNAGYGGVYGMNMGCFLGLRGGPLRFALGSNALLGVFAPQIVKGADLSLNLSIGF
ncbi:MAG: hypothetical protein HYZ16_00185 [Bacteroidetes bacterium]|nr:hypothetical protein [Bacteroidota bacterium]